MWIRRIGQKGNAEAIVLPSAALGALGWERGDFIRISMTMSGELLLTKFNPATVPDRASAALEPLPQIEYA